MNTPSILIISNTKDYSTDYIVNQLVLLGKSYFRLNMDQLREFEIIFNISDKVLCIKYKNNDIVFTDETLKSVYYRAPVFLRENLSYSSVEEQLEKQQWAAFVRSIIIFKNAKWINHPGATYQSEIKPFQLTVAKEIGFNIPTTVVTNTVPDKIFNVNSEIVLKTIDPAVVNCEDKLGFIYTNFVKFNDLYSYQTEQIPFFIQQALLPKIDIRVTVVDTKAFAFSITKDGDGVDEDWRTVTERVNFAVFNLPKEVSKKCISITKKLGLLFSGIDLIQKDDEYYFVEINPTGEWSWLMKHTGVPLDKEIATIL